MVQPAVQADTFPRALARLLIDGVVRKRLPMSRHEAAVVLVLAIAIGVGALLLAPVVWLLDRNTPREDYD